MPNFKKNPAPFMMKNSALHASAKHGSPMQGNYGSPAKHGVVGADGKNLTEDTAIKV